MNNPFFNQGEPNQAHVMQTVNPAQNFIQFAQNFQGNPREEVQKLLNSGRMTQEQYQFVMGHIRQRFPFMGRM